MIAFLAAILAAFFTWIVRGVARRAGWVAAANPIVPQRRAPAALMGGVAIAGGALVAGALARLPLDHTTLVWVPAGLVMLGIGAWDDLRVMSARHKLLAVTAVAIVTVVAGTPAPISPWGWLNTIVATAWIVLLVNAVNVTDVCDGLAAGLAAIGLLALGAWDPGVRGPAWAMAGACAGFLVFNRPPASIYLGDAGSLMLGFTLAVLSLRTVSHGVDWPHLARATGSVAVFLFETVLLIGVRSARGLPFWKGSPDHFSLRMQAAGLSKGITDLVSWAAAGAIVVMVARLPAWSPVARFAALVLFVTAAIAAARWLLRHDPRRVDRASSTARLTAAELIERLGLEPLPMEGGLYRETWRSSVPLPGVAAPPGVMRSAGTAIYYLLTPATSSAMHRLPIDELYHFLLGDPVEMLQLADGTPARRLVLGHDLRVGEALQVVVPAGTWQGSRLRAGGAWALMSVTVAPGFEFSDYECGDANALAAAWPDAAAFVRALAR